MKHWKHKYAVLKLQPWASLELDSGQSLSMSTEGTAGFLPVFNTRKQAVKFAGDERLVVQITRVEA